MVTTMVLNTKHWNDHTKYATKLKKEFETGIAGGSLVYVPIVAATLLTLPSIAGK